MTKILSFDQLHDDEWQRFGDEQVEIANALIADISTLRERGAALAETGIRLALEVNADVAPEDYHDLLPLLDMVVIRFSKFADGRGFSSARELRERFQYTGTVRAAGTFLPDQMGYLARVGFDAWELPPDGREPTYQREIERFKAAYQVAPGDRRISIAYRKPA